MHVADNGDGTFTNPVMPNAHWSDPAVIRARDRFYCVTSSIDTCPVMQVLESRDLVNWDVIGSVSRGWLDDLPSIQNWSPRISMVNGAFRIHFHMTERCFAVVEAGNPAGPWRRVTRHGLSDMVEQWAASVFEDARGSLYMVASNWIQELSADGLSFRGPRTVVTEGFLENPWLIEREGWYYWFCSENGTDVWGILPDKSKVSVWRSRHVLGPYEKCPRTLIRANAAFQCPNTGSAVLGPDDRWWYLYNTLEVQRLSLCRQLNLDPLDWEPDGWPRVNADRGPGLTHRKPLQGFGPTWLPEPSDDFDTPVLEGVSGGVLGRKWLFKREDPSAWSLQKRKGWLSMRAAFPSIDNRSPHNMAVQRSVSAYYAIETMMEFEPLAAGQQAGLLVKEIVTGCGVAICIEQTNRRWLKVWHMSPEGHRDVGGLLYPDARVFLRIEVDGVLFRCLYGTDGVRWTALGPDYPFTYRSGYFTTFHPGLFAGEKVESKTECWAHFDYFRLVDGEQPDRDGR